MSKSPNINKILRLPIHKGCSARGADMGRRNLIGEPAKLYLQRVRFVDSCYDPGGAYWGLPCNLWCAFADGEDLNAATMIFVRARTREEAKKAAMGVIDQRTGDTALWSFRR